MQENEIVLYQPNETTRIEVRLDDETVWLTANQMADLFQRDEKTIRKHINNVFADGELLKDINTHFLRLDGVKQPVAFYTLDVIISVGYRVNSYRGVQFRQWANKVLKEYLLIDNDVYHVGASIKDLGKRWFAIMKMQDTKADQILSHILPMGGVK